MKMERTINDKELASFYFYADTRRSECNEITLQEIAQEYLEKLGNSAPSESQSVVDNEDKEKSSYTPKTAEDYCWEMLKILNDAGFK